jgi:uncharacterized damage-inducible protein DinB
MTVIDTFIQLWDTNRKRTRALLDRIEKTERAEEVLGWRPAPGRAHIAWQIMHIGITEELFATERLNAGEPDYPELVPRFRGGSTPDDEIPSLTQIRDVLDHSREHLLKTIRTLSDQDLPTTPDGFLQQRGWSIQTMLHILSWHEAHHQGQAHAIANLWEASQAAA